jgi:hypothetical protein
MRTFFFWTTASGAGSLAGATWHLVATAQPCPSAVINCEKSSQNIAYIHKTVIINKRFNYFNNIHRKKNIIEDRAYSQALCIIVDISCWI